MFKTKATKIDQKKGGSETSTHRPCWYLTATSQSHTAPLTVAQGEAFCLLFCDLTGGHHQVLWESFTSSTPTLIWGFSFPRHSTLAEQVRRKRGREERDGGKTKKWHKRGWRKKSTRRDAKENAEGERTNNKKGGKRPQELYVVSFLYFLSLSLRLLPLLVPPFSSSIFAVFDGPFPKYKTGKRKGVRAEGSCFRFASLCVVSSCLFTSFLCVCVVGIGKEELKSKTRRRR